MSDVEIFEDAIEALALSPQVQADLKARMNQVVAVAKATAPVLTGDYKASIHRVERADADGTVHVDTNVHYAIYVEHGTRQTDRNGRSIHPPRYNLSHALDAAGGDHDV
ncbi:HK97 gp10 family phage protein [Streptomyces sp. 4R-3d]|uniref:HK97 gp10 family phage protein n=1 Tax=Streptomyces sp. 4R-3d TaxID=2559605 RepID=UPI001072153D|nr:HK97 gp10 family phage protein [Streptomyces sp. 4R-3d]TFI30163.1 HK97 gp10 family phage protein [Streptomyces sp. 4R-3d]